MNRRFVVLIDSAATGEERDAVTEYFKNTDRYGFWHHFPFSWLVTTTDETISAVELRGEIQEKLGGTSIVVLQIDDGTAWCAYGTKAETEWLHETWSKD